MTKIKAITIRQPWANLIACGIKTIETRNRKIKYRGPLAIHAGKVVDKDAFDILKKTDLEKFFKCNLSLEPLGVIIAITELIDIIEYHNSEAFYDDVLGHLLSPPFAYTRYGWCFPTGKIKNTEPQIITPPISCRGQQGLFEVEI